ncbi:MAG TPA: LysM domain-containing protein [Desulfonatronum sp.]|nr:LysM domain-containing protein [Desulfonatronum sp.]
MDKKSWLQKLEAMEQEQQETTQPESDNSIPRVFLEGRGKFLILGGIGVVVLVLLVVIFSSGKDTVSERQLQDILARLDVLESRLVGLENQEGGRQQALVRMQGDFSILTMRVDKLSREMKEQFADVAAKKEQPSSATAAPKPAAQQQPQQAAPPAAPKPAAGTSPTQSKPQAATPVKPAASKPVLHEVRAGETLYRISRTYGVTVDEIRQLNKIGTDDLIHPGQLLTIKK